MSIGEDDQIRVWCRKQKIHLQTILELYSFTHDVALSGECKLVVWTNIVAITKIWKVDKGKLVFRSSDLPGVPQPLPALEAQNALENDLSKSSTMWPKSVGRLSDDVFLNGSSIYYWHGGGKELLALLRPVDTFLYPAIDRWEFCRNNGTLVTTVGGRLVICKLEGRRAFWFA